MNWLKSLEQAQSIDAVLELANDYLASHPDDFWSWLAVAERPESLGSEDELHLWHQALVQELTRFKSPSAKIQEACVFFVSASVRAHQIRLRKDDKGPSNDREFSAAAHQGGGGR